MQFSIKETLRSVAAPLFGRQRAAQVAALCYRFLRGEKQVLLITSRGTGRWIIPKGWPMQGMSDAQAAAQEAWEEAGVKPANVGDDPIGSYGYDKILDNGAPLPVQAQVYPVEVKDLAANFPEVDERRRKWVSPDVAADLVDEPDLQAIFKTL